MPYVYKPQTQVAGAAKKGQPNRKKMARLALRIKSWEETVNRAENRGKDMSGYHCPGSMQ